MSKKEPKLLCCRATLSGGTCVPGDLKRCRLSLFLSRKGSVVDWPAILSSSTDWQQAEDRERVEG